MTTVTDRTAPTCNVITSIPRELSDKLDFLCKKRGVSRASLLRELITTFLTQESSNG